MSFGVPFTPEEASTFAPGVDTLFYGLLAFTILLGGALTTLVVGYAVKYRAGSKADRTGERTRSLPLEVSWTLASLLVAFVFFAWGAALFVDRDRPPADALEIAGLGKPVAAERFPRGEPPSGGRGGRPESDNVVEWRVAT